MPELSKERIAEIEKRARIAVINERLTEVYKDDEYKPVHTPFHTTSKDIIDKLPDLDGSILILSDCGLLVAAMLRKRYADYTFVVHTEKQANFARELGVTKILMVNYNNCINELEKQIMGLKFDIIIGNPPYKAGLHIKIIKSCLDHLLENGICVMIHPSTPYIRPGKNKLRNHLQECIFIQGKDIWPNIKLWVPLAIVYLRKNIQSDFILNINNTHSIINHTTELTTFGINDTLNNIQNKLTSKQTLHKVVHKGIKNCPNSSFYVMISGICGNAQQHDMYFMLPQRAQLKTNIRTKPGKWHNFMFNTYEEAYNFCNFMVSKLAMAALALKKINQNVQQTELSAIPWLDFSKHWTDDMLYEHFKFTKEEIAFIDSFPAHPQRK